jgi:hypothetical protein
VAGLAENAGNHLSCLLPTIGRSEREMSMSSDQPLTLRTLKDAFQAAGLRPARVQLLQQTAEGYDYWRRLSRAYVAVCREYDAGGSLLICVRHFVTQRWGSCDLIALSRVIDWLVAEHELTPEQAESITLAEIVGKLRGMEPDEGDDSRLFLRRVGKVWHLRYQNEKADFPVAGNQFLGWLVKLLSMPGRSLTVAELLGDPDGKLAADALLGGECVTDQEGIRAIKERIEEIDEIAKGTGGSEELDNERAELLKQLMGSSATGRVRASVCKAYNNITTQKRQFLKKLQSEMPQLASHLKACILPFANDCTLSYRPPNGMPRWNIENLPA